MGLGMSKVIIIGAGGVGGVVAHKCAQVPGVFGEIVLASRNEDKCRAIAAGIDREIRTARVDADRVPELVALFEAEKPDLVINVALPYQDLSIMDACLEAGIHYLDTANYEPPETAKFEYSWQWAYRERFRERGLMALLGSGFDPGVTNVFTAWMAKHEFDEIHELDIIDANAGNHGMPFATNFNPEINIREVTAPCRHFEEGEWIETPAAFDQPHLRFPRRHRSPGRSTGCTTRNWNPCEALARSRAAAVLDDLFRQLPQAPRGPQNVGMTRIDPVEFQGQDCSTPIPQGGPARSGESRPT